MGTCEGREARQPRGRELCSVWAGGGCSDRTGSSGKRATCEPCLQENDRLKWESNGISDAEGRGYLSNALT